MEMEINNIKCIVIGVNHHNTLGVIRALGYRGIKPYVILISSSRQNYVVNSKYIQKYQLLSSSKEVVQVLIKYKYVFNNKPVIISCADIVTAELDAHIEELMQFYYLPVAQGNMCKVMNKNLMTEIAKGCGIRTPQSVKFSNLNFKNGGGYIFKPMKSIDGTKSDISIIKNRKDLDLYLSSTHCKNLQIQEYIDKELEFQLIGCSLNNGEIVIIPGASVILRQPDNTNTGYLKYSSFDNFHFDKLEECKSFIRTIGYSGLFSMEFLRGKDGKDYFMEINMRNDGNSICVTAAGVNLPYVWYSYCIGTDDWQTEILHEIKDTIVMPEFDDFVNVLKHKISIFQWIRDVRHTDCFMEYDSTDPKPFYIGLRTQLLNYMKLALKKIHLKK